MNFEYSESQNYFNELADSFGKEEIYPSEIDWENKKTILEKS